jgi:hypothetical protein
MDDLEKRVTTLEMEFKEYMAIFYKWLDETRQEMKEFRSAHEERLRRLEDQNAKTVEVLTLLERNDRKQGETQGMLVQILQAMDDKLDNHEGRLNRSGI